MLFNSLSFLLWFLPITAAVYSVSAPRWRQCILLVASYVFYAWWHPLFCGLLLLTTSVDYLAASKIATAKTHQGRRAALCASLFINLGILAVFKYYMMANATITYFFGSSPLPAWEILLPVGISFYTFQSISYSIDVFLGKAKTATRFTDFACYVSLFPQLIAGPIVRYHEIADQLHTRTHTLNKAAEGIYRFLIGLSKKVLLADTCSLLADAAFTGTDLSTPMAWIGVLAYTLQIYFDFSGYSDMAIGLGLLFGFRFPENFDRPYLSKSITEFWQRWHITLGNWFRDYLYIPLGGNRNGWIYTARNLLITMFLAGLWHGAAWTFVVWGLYYGILLVVERCTRSMRSHVPIVLQVLLTFFLVVMGWVLFRATSFASAVSIYKALFVMQYGPISPYAIWILLIGFTYIGFEHHIPKMPKRFSSLLALLCCMLLLINLVVIAGNTASPFIYFQF